MPADTPELKRIPQTAEDLVANKIDIPENVELEPAEVVQPVYITDINGDPFEGNFILRLITSDDDMLASQMKLRLCGGAPIHLLSPGEQAMFDAYAMCIVMFQKVEGKIDAAPPWWYKKPRRELPPELIGELYNALRSHTDRYFRRNPETGEIETGRCVVKFGERRGAN
jgi:hypothetical protein